MYTLTSALRPAGLGLERPTPPPASANAVTCSRTMDQFVTKWKLSRLALPPESLISADLGQESAAQGHSLAQPVSSLVTGSRPRPWLYVLAELLSRDNGSGAKEL